MENKIKDFIHHSKAHDKSVLCATTYKAFFFFAIFISFSKKIAQLICCFCHKLNIIYKNKKKKKRKSVNSRLAEKRKVQDDRKTSNRRE